MKFSRPVLAHEEIESDQGMVTAQHRIGAEIGAQVLERGGNAVDAAITTAFAMGVLQPLMNGIGGGGLIVVHMEGGGGGAIDYGMQVPALAGPDTYELDDFLEPPATASQRYAHRFSYPRVRENANVEGHTAIATPGTLSGLVEALDKWGTISLDQALSPAIRLAENGFPVGYHLALAVYGSLGHFMKLPATRAIFCPDGTPLTTGTIFVQAAHGRSLRHISTDGPDAFYRGEIAQMISDDAAAHGGYLRKEDLAQYRPIVHEKPMLGSYRGYGMKGVSGTCAGPTVFEILNIIENFDLSGLSHGSPELLHLIVEAIKLAVVDRFTFMGDVGLNQLLTSTLTSKAYARERAKALDRSAATAPRAGDLWSVMECSMPDAFPAPAGIPLDGAIKEGTTTLATVDKARNAVSLTQTNYSFGGVVAGGSGIVMNNGMGWCCPIPGTVNSVIPRSKPLNNMTPMILLRDGRFYSALGASGGRRIWTAIVQSIVNHIDFGMSLQEAIQAPRIHVESDDVLMDERLGDGVRGILGDLGHLLELETPSYVSSPYAEPNGIWTDGSVLRSAIYPVAKPSFAAGI